MKYYVEITQHTPETDLDRALKSLSVSAKPEELVCVDSVKRSLYPIDIELLLEIVFKRIELRQCCAFFGESEYGPEELLIVDSNDIATASSPSLLADSHALASQSVGSLSAEARSALRRTLPKPKMPLQRTQIFLPPRSVRVPERIEPTKARKS